MPTRCWCEKFALVIGFVPSHKSNIERFRKIWRESLLKIYNSIFKTTLDELHKAMFQNRHLDIHNFDPFVKSLISRYPANPSVPSSHFLFSRCFNKTLRLWHGNLWKMRGENDGLVWRLNLKTSMLLSSFEESFKGRTSSVSYIRYCLIQYNFLLKVKSLSSKNLVKTTAENTLSQVFYKYVHNFLPWTDTLFKAFNMYSRGLYKRYVHFGINYMYHD